MPIIDFPSVFLKADKDVVSGDVIKFLDAGEYDERGNGAWIFLVLVEKNGVKKKFSLNKTNWKAISKVYGTNSDVWVNKEMEVVVIDTQNPQGELVKAVRLKVVGADDEVEVGDDVNEPPF